MHEKRVHVSDCIVPIYNIVIRELHHVRHDNLACILPAIPVGHNYELIVRGMRHFERKQRTGIDFSSGKRMKMNFPPSLFPHFARCSCSCKCPNFAIVFVPQLALNLPLHDPVKRQILSHSPLRNFRFHFQPRAPAHVSLGHARKKPRTVSESMRIVDCTVRMIPAEKLIENLRAVLHCKTPSSLYGDYLRKRIYLRSRSRGACSLFKAVPFHPIHRFDKHGQTVITVGNL